ncbi:hemerythrin domain-containing protein [Emcibacter nanhaiensis]|uniref:Hemerythrin domain-containing protein n=1 Tax=Emcibacter nanhaiensis TaxID=1505037 RepID=A0A501PFX9_9PROT|nr:hemerythrin domain-containing protein [Emcibacter nanhaiensis]TPD58947.1 hemerythrin domain-containing protein [Emcibacter nanhaiensis]
MTPNSKQKLFDAFREDHALLGRGLHSLRERLVARDWEGARHQAQQLNREAGAHIAFEEEDFYPALKAFLDEEEVEEMYRDHKEGLRLVADVMDAPDEDFQSDQRASDFVTRVDHMSDHVSECGELFGAMGGLDEEDTKKLLERLEYWRKVAPSWSGVAGQSQTPE